MAGELNAASSSITMRRSASVLVGREQEQVFLREELAASLSGQGRLVLLGGEAGIGKTTLAKHLLREARARGMRVLAGHCYDLTNTPPYGPWLDLVSGYASGDDLPSPPAAFAGGTLERVTDQAALYAEVRRFLAALSDERPLVVLLEDLHWADPASLELLRHVAPHLRHWPVLLLATYRVDELTRRHPFAQQLPALVREAEGLRLDLRRLDTDALGVLVAAYYRLPAVEAGRLVAYLDHHAEGNPFFATEILRALEEEGLLGQTEGTWELGALDRVVVPSLLRQVIDGRLARLGEIVREPLAMAAVLGQEVPLALWAEVAALGDEKLLAIVEQTVEAHLLEAARDGLHVRFVHALTREALYEGIFPPRRRLWHSQVAEALMMEGNPDPDAVAYHLQQAGDPRAWEWLVKAADRAQHAYAWLTAAERLRAAASLIAGIEDEEQTRCRLARRIGWLQRFSDPAGAIPAVDDALRAAARIGDAFSAAELGWLRGALLMYADRLRAAIAEQSAAKRHFDAIDIASIEASGAPGPIQSWFAEGLPVTTSIDTTEDELAGERLREGARRYRRANLLWLCASSGQPETAIEDDEEFVALADVPGTRGSMLAAVAFTYHALGIAHAARGHPETARRMWARARALFAQLDHHALTAFTHLNQLRDVALPYDAADPAMRRGLAAGAEAALCRAGGALGPGVSPRLAWLNCLVLDGKWDEADRILEGLPLPGNNYLRREVTAARAVLARHRGEPDVAWAQIRPLFPDGPATAPGDLIHQEGLFLQRMAADLCLDAGDLPGARLWLAAHDRWLAWSESVLGRADGQIAWARFHLAERDTDRARASAMEALALETAPDQPLARLSALRLLGEIATAERGFTDAEAHLTAALDLAGVCEAPFERALTLLGIAKLRLAMGAVAEATAALVEVRHICTPLRAARTLARADVLTARLATIATGESHPAGLTQREVDVLRLLARRQTDKEIAEALFLGHRTVQSHVAHILNKLGVGNRREAAAAAERLGLQ